VGTILSKVGLPSSCSTCGVDCDKPSCDCPECQIRRELANEISKKYAYSKVQTVLPEGGHCASCGDHCDCAACSERTAAIADIAS